MRWPEPLKKGDTVALLAPASPVDRDALDRGMRYLASLSLNVRLYPSLEQRYGYLAGHDEARARDFIEAWNDPEIRAIWAARGGYGTMRLFPYLAQEKMQETGKWVIGYSDITALHAYLYRRFGIVTLHAPMVERCSSTEAVVYTVLQDLQPESHTDLQPGSQKEGLRMLHDRQVETILFGRLGDLGGALLPPVPEPDIPRLFRPGQARGRLVGGNLSLVTALIGTPWEIETKGNILFLEEVGEAPYRIDRMLAQLKLAGHLSRVAGIVLGTFTDCEPLQGRPSLSLRELWEEYFGGLGIPVIENFPAGHGRMNVPLPLGSAVTLDTNRLPHAEWFRVMA